MDLKSYLIEKRKLVDDALRRYLPEPSGPAADVVQAMHYSLFAGGKRLRPILCLAGNGAVGGEDGHALPAACALEMIHTYSLIHDDLPVMDNDDFRRGKPTNHKVFGEALAVLAGDGLLTEAFRVMACAEPAGSADPRSRLTVICLIARAAGHRGMVGGQAMDILSQGRDEHPFAVEQIHSHKTGALISASVTAGAVLGGGDTDRIKALTSYGDRIGLAFQIADDILDIEGSKEELGKGVGGDARKGKMTYPAVFGLNRSKQIQTRLLDEALEYLEPFDRKADPLRLIARYIIERRK